MKNSQARITIVFYKPYGVLSQFTPGLHPGGHQTLAAFGPFPPGVYAAGRLDADSEGLLVLTDDTSLAHRLTDPKFGHERTYLVQVEGVPDEADLSRLREGTIRVEGRAVLSASVRLLPESPDLPPRPVPIRSRKSLPTAWLEITLREGRNRQVRKMTAAVGHPALRLLRTRISTVSLEGLTPGGWRTLTDAEAQELCARPADPSTSVRQWGGRRHPGRRNYRSRWNWR